MPPIILNRLTVRNAAKLAVRSVHYTAWCDDEGKVLDDGTLFRHGAAGLSAVLSGTPPAMAARSALGFDVTIEEHRRRSPRCRCKGPCAATVLCAAGFDVSALKPFRMQSFPFAGGNMTISRTGFTGDLGYELWTTPTKPWPCGMT